MMPRKKEVIHDWAKIADIIIQTLPALQTGMWTVPYISLERLKLLVPKTSIQKSVKNRMLRLIKEAQNGILHRDFVLAGDVCYKFVKYVYKELDKHSERKIKEELHRMYQELSNKYSNKAAGGTYHEVFSLIGNRVRTVADSAFLFNKFEIAKRQCDEILTLLKKISVIPHAVQERFISEVSMIQKAVNERDSVRVLKKASSLLLYAIKVQNKYYTELSQPYKEEPPWYIY